MNFCVTKNFVIYSVQDTISTLSNKSGTVHRFLLLIILIQKAFVPEAEEGVILILPTIYCSSVFYMLLTRFTFSENV